MKCSRGEAKDDLSTVLIAGSTLTLDVQMIAAADGAPKILDRRGLGEISFAPG